MSTHFGILGGKPLSEIDQLKKRIGDLETALHLLKQRMDVQEFKALDDLIDLKQLRNALSDASIAIADGLTKTPFGFTPEQQRVWDATAKRLEKPCK